MCVCVSFVRPSDCPSVRLCVRLSVRLLSVSNKPWLCFCVCVFRAVMKTALCLLLFSQGTRQHNNLVEFPKLGIRQHMISLSFLWRSNTMLHLLCFWAGVKNQISWVCFLTRWQTRCSCVFWGGYETMSCVFDCESITKTMLSLPQPKALCLYMCSCWGQKCAPGGFRQWACVLNVHFLSR